MTRTASGWRVGTARRAITPTKPMWMAGYAAREAPSQGTERELTVTATAFEDETGTQAVLVSVEVLFVPARLRERVVARQPQDLPPEAILLAATHTHGGPRLDADRIGDVENANVLRERIETYRERLVGEIEVAIEEAVADLQPASVHYDRSQCGFGMNRRRPTPDGIQLDVNPDGHVDTEVPVLVSIRDGEVRAIVFGYACHPTAVFDDLRFNADWPGFAIDNLESRYSEATAQFLPGFAGNQDPFPRGSMELARRHGRTMATAVEVAVESRLRRVAGPIRTCFEVHDVPFTAPSVADVEAMVDADDDRTRRRGERLREELEERGAIRTEFPMPFQGIAIGDAVTMCGLGGEIFVEYGNRLKRNGPGAVWPVGYANARVGYVPTAQAIVDGGYESNRAVDTRRYPGPMDPGVEDRLDRHALSIVRRVGGP